VPLSTRLRRWGYRLAYRLLHVYWFVRRPRTRGVKCMLSRGETVLLVRHTYGPAEWELPGGGLRRDEIPVSGARREMQEELGICPESWADLGSITGRLHHHHNTLHCFQAELPDPELTIDPGEIAVARWFPRQQLPPDVGRYVREIVARALPPQRS
jgi:ADP-ribose pyrophosphatase YjhB (NUDIX family)